MTAAEGAIVVGVDGSEGSGDALRWAAHLASRRHLDVVIAHGLQVAALYYGGGLAGTGAVFDSVQEEGQRIVEDARKLVLSVDGTLEVSTELVIDPPVALLLELSRRARMIVLGRTGTGGFTGMLVGATTATVVSHAHCPVAVIRGRDDSVPQDGPVIVGIDGSPNSEQAVAVAFEEAGFRGVPLIALHAWSDVTYDSTAGTARLVPQWEVLEPAEERLLAQRLAGWQEKYPEVEVRRRLVRDRPSHALLEEAAHAQLVVVGSRGRGGFRGMLLGSTSQALVHHAECPVLVVRPEPKA